MADEIKDEDVKEPVVETVEEPVLDTPPDLLTSILSAIADLKGDIANLTQKTESQDSPLEEPPVTEEAPVEEEKPEEPEKELDEEEQEDISDMFKD